MTLSDVAVPGGKIEIMCDFVMVEVIGPAEATDVGGDELARIGKLANHINLHALKAAPRVADEAAMFEQQTGITASGGKRDLIPAVVGLAPIGSYPGAIQRVEGSVFQFEPIIELTTRVGIEGLVGEFVSDLPSDHVGIMPEAPRKLLYDGR